MLHQAVPKFPLVPCKRLRITRLCAGPERLHPILLEEFAFAKDIGKLQKTYVEFSRLLRKVLSPSDHHRYAKQILKRSPIQVLPAPNAAELFRVHVSILNRNATVSVILNIILPSFGTIYVYFEQLFFNPETIMG